MKKENMKKENILPCSICRELHSDDRTLSYDGRGVNSCGMYRDRIATIPDEYRHLGPVLSMAPQLLESVESLLKWAIEANNRIKYEKYNGLQLGGNPEANPIFKQAKKVLQSLGKGPLMNRDFIMFTPEKFKAFKEAYEKAVKDGKESFVFEGREALTAWAKYALEYLEDQFKHAKP